MPGFDLENILSYRKFVENQIKNELGSVEALLRQEEAQCLETKYRKDQAEQSFRNRINHGASAIQYRIHKDYMEELKKNILRQQCRIQEIELKTHQIRENLMAATKDKKMMQKLKEKRMQDFTYMEKRKETAMLDDLSTGAYIRNREAV
jgi:flagellar protein FliJ